MFYHINKLLSMLLYHIFAPNSLPFLSFIYPSSLLGMVGFSFSLGDVLLARSSLVGNQSFILGAKTSAGELNNLLE